MKNKIKPVEFLNRLTELDKAIKDLDSKLTPLRADLITMHSILTGLINSGRFDLVLQRSIIEDLQRCNSIVKKYLEVLNESQV